MKFEVRVCETRVYKLPFTFVFLELLVHSCQVVEALTAGSDYRACVRFLGNRKVTGRKSK